ncbi:hypothetical protein [Streptomyces sp. NPDC017993]|uniref:hypothetical protein n=1 Tax=Streptomyces sp. NPDC017993 TaxID=3365027 RepID=UPI00378BA5D5
MVSGPKTDGTDDYEKKIEEKNRKEILKEQFGSHKVVKKSSSNFHHHGLDALRAMVENSDADALESAGDHWRASADRLAGEDGRGGIRKTFMDAIDHASAHWHGTAAASFRREALKVLTKIDRTYGHARNIETMLIGNRTSGPHGGVAHSVREAKKAMSKIEDAGSFEGFVDQNGKDGADAQFHKDMADPKMDAKMALELNRDNLSLSKERQVEAVIVMEELASNYRDNHAAISDSPGPAPGPGHDWPTEPRQPSSPAPVNMPTPGGPRVKPSNLAPHGPSGPSAPFDPRGVNINPSPPVKTGLDGLQGGTMTPTNPGIPGGGSTGGGGGHSAGGGGGGSAGMPGMMPGMPGKGGGAMGAGGGGRGGGAMGGRAGAGRAGMPGGGMGGGAGGGAAGRGGGAAGRSGAQARTRGGMVGKPGGPMGGTKQGGSGLHRSSGGTKAGTGQGGKGMAGAPGARGNGKGENERTTKQRPDYLIEDEETWTPQRNVAPRVIE